MEGKLLPSRGIAEGFMRELYLSWPAQGTGSGPSPHPAKGSLVALRTLAPSTRWGRAGHSRRKNYVSRHAAWQG